MTPRDLYQILQVDPAADAVCLRGRNQDPITIGTRAASTLFVDGQKLGRTAAEVISHYGPRPQVSLRDLAIAAGL